MSFSDIFKTTSKNYFTPESKKVAFFYLFATSNAKLGVDQIDLLITLDCLVGMYTMFNFLNFFQFE